MRCLIMRVTELTDRANGSCSGCETGTRWQMEAIMGFPKVFKRKVETSQQPVLSPEGAQATRLRRATRRGESAAEGPVQSLKDPCRHLALAARWSKVHEVSAEQ